MNKNLLTMKTSLTLLVLLIFGSTFLTAQNINWSGLMKDNSGNALANTSVALTFSILEGPGETLVYRETHNTTTGSSGLVSAEIGGGTVSMGVFANLDFTKAYKLRTEADSGNGNVVLGVSEFKAVPLAKSANSAEMAKSAEKMQKGTSSIEIDNGNQILIKENGTNSVIISNGELKVPALAGNGVQNLEVTAQGKIQRKGVQYATRILSINAAQLSAPGYRYELDSGFYNESGSTGNKIYVGVNLPGDDGAKIKSLTMEFLDNTSLSGFDVKLWKVGKDPSTATERKVVASVNSTTTFVNTAWQSVTTSNIDAQSAVISNNYYSYVLEISGRLDWFTGKNRMALNKILISYEIPD